eukprot:scaffold24197_cov51-Attheya_sp.AAC.3
MVGPHWSQICDGWDAFAGKCDSHWLLRPSINRAAVSLMGPHLCECSITPVVGSYICSGGGGHEEANCWHSGWPLEGQRKRVRTVEEEVEWSLRLVRARRVRRRAMKPPPWRSCGESHPKWLAFPPGKTCSGA